MIFAISARFGWRFGNIFLEGGFKLSHAIFSEVLR